MNSSSVELYLWQSWTAWVRNLFLRKYFAIASVRLFLVWDHFMLIFNLQGGVWVTQAYADRILYLCEDQLVATRILEHWPTSPSLQCLDYRLASYYHPVLIINFFLVYFSWKVSPFLPLWRFSFPMLCFMWAQRLTPTPKWVLIPKPVSPWDQQPAPPPSTAPGLFAALTHTVNILIF